MFKFRRMSVLLVLFLALALVVAGCGGKKAEEPKKDAPPEPEEFKVGFVYVGPIGDAGWTYAHDQGRLYLENNVPGVKTFYVESVPEGADAERVMTEMVQQGAKVIFATSFGYMEYLINVANKYPDVVFEHCSGYMTAPNAANYFGKMYQARYLSGILAGMKTESNIIGYVGAFSIPEVVRGINAFTLGVRSVNPDAKVIVSWTNTWYDPATEKQAALALLDVGADVIAQHQDTPGPQQAAQERGKWGIGYNTDMRQFAPEATMTSPVWNWGPYYVNVVKSVMDGTWKSHEYWGPMSDGIVDIGPFNDKLVTPEMKEKVLAAREAILKGELDVFAGPIKDQSGQIRVPEGASMTDAEKLSFDWFVEGVEGKIE
ncbi:MAG: BMP family ABC transporter substrate-binding protein [Bacillota bacterium]